MALDGFYALCCASILMAGQIGLASASPGGEDRDQAITSTLAVQTAMQQAREHMIKNDFRAAVHALESQLPRINGNRNYLALLQDAYRGCIKELRLAKQDVQAQTYLERLRILDPGAILDKTLAGATAAPTASPPATGKPAATVRMKGEEDYDDPFQDGKPAARSVVMAMAPAAVAAQPSNRGRELLAKAEREFDGRNYREARLLYDQANQEDRTLVDSCRERWAYCKLNYVVEQLNQPATTGLPSDLETEVQAAVGLSSKISEQASALLGELARRRAKPAALELRAEVSIRHFEKNADGYYCTESANFRIFHAQPKELAEQAARVAEATRLDMQRKWFGSTHPDWNPKCDLFLHATAQDYGRVTGVPPTSPGHSSLRMEAGQVVGRRIDLHCDDVNMLPAVLPHETTHVVLAGMFGEQPVPRWADEGMAVLTEPREKVERHTRALAKCQQDGQILRLRQLIQLNDYPDPRYITAFYAQSVSLVDFLSREKSPQVFSEFLREGLRTNYESALQRFYGFRNFDELEQRWQQFATQDRAAVVRGGK